MLTLFLYQLRIQKPKNINKVVAIYISESKKKIKEFIMTLKNNLEK